MSKKVAILIDLANIGNAFNAVKKNQKLPFTIKMDFNKIVSAISLGNEVVSKSVFTGTLPNVDLKSQRGFFDYFTRNDFKVITKPCKIIRQDDESEKMKANFDVEIACVACRHIWRRECSEIILVSGDSDFDYLIRMAKELDFKITIVSSNGTISKELRNSADRLILLDNLDLRDLSFDSEQRRAA